MAKEDENGSGSLWGENGQELRQASKNGPAAKKSYGLWKLAAAALVAVLAGAVYYSYFFRPRSADVGIEFQKPDQVLLGEKFSIKVSFSNYSDNVLKDAGISLLLPDGVYFYGQSQDQRVLQQAVGDIGPGSVNQQAFDLIAAAGANSVKRLQAKLKYASGNSNAQFEKSSDVDVVIGQPAVNLSLGAPQSVFNGQDFTIKIDYANNAGQEFKNLKLKIDYPSVFQFERSTVEPSGAANDSWDLGTLAPGSQGSISITGNIVGPERSFVNLNADLAADYLGISYQINSQSADVGISQAPLSLAISMADSSGSDTPAPGDYLTYSLTYVNNSSVVMQNAVITAQPVGEMIDFTTIKSDGSFNSLNNTIIWRVANTAELLNVAPGQSGSVNFTVQLKKSYPIRLLSDKNYTLKVGAQIESPTVPAGTEAQKTISVASLESKVAGNLALSAEAYWRDAASGILNNGPYPPVVNQPTDYAIHWRLANYATDVANVTVSAFLQSGSRLTGVVKSNIDTSPVYDPNSGLVSWTIPSIPATKGVVGDSVEAIFQIENTPAITQLRQIIPLLSETKVEWTDSFVGKIFQSSAMALDTNLSYDKTITISDKLVRQSPK